jgi:di/tricarboxylate transporter
MVMPPVDPMWQMWATFAVIAGAIVIYASERLAMEITSAGVLAVLLVLFHFAPVGEGGNLLDAAALLAGFADPALITILALIVVGQGLIQTGAIEMVIAPVTGRLGARHLVMMSLLFAGIIALSAFINNTPVVVIFIPVVMALAQRAALSPGRYMMAVSFSAILGGMTTLIGSSANLLVSGVVQDLGMPAIGFFDFSLPGLFLAGIGVVYLILIAPRLLPDRATMAHEYVGIDGRHYIAQITVRPDSRLIGERAVAGRFEALPEMTVRLFQRGNKTELPPYDDIVIEAGDVLVVAATRRALAEALPSTPSLLPVDGEVGDSDQVMVEAMVAPASRMVGRNLRQVGFHYQTQCLVLGVQRRSRMLRENLDAIRMEVGDILLILGHSSDVRALRRIRDIVLLEWSAHDVAARRYARRAAAIFGLVVIGAAAGLMPIVILAVSGAVAMLVAGCLNVRQAGRSLDRRVILLLPAALAMGAAMQATGGAAYLAHLLVAYSAGWGPAITLAALFLVVAVLTNLISNSATAVLFTPIAVGTAVELGVSPWPFVHAVIFAANCCFATPIGYQTNLLVMGPGHYRFADFLKVGGPLVDRL